MSVSIQELRVMRRVSLRLMPFIFLLYVINFLDRTNVSIAALQMNHDLQFSPAVFGLGSGIFFLGYALFEVPSNLILARVGARRWIARIMITWGVLAASMMWVKTPTQFYVLRLLLGIAEAGFFPGIIYYLTDWFPAVYRARALSRFTVAIPIAQAISGGIGGSLLALNGHMQLAGWQWLFLVEGLPSVLLGITVLFFLTDRPVGAHWLAEEDSLWLCERLRRERQAIPVAASAHGFSGFGSPLTWFLALGYFAYYSVLFAQTAWGPLIIRQGLGLGDSATGLVFAGIALLAAAFYLIAAVASDRSGDRCGYAAFGLAVATAGCVGMAVVPNPGLRIVALALIPIGGGVFLPSFWCLPTKLFTGATGAGSIALISALGSTGGFFGPALVGFFKHVTGGDEGAFWMLAVVGMIGCVIFAGLRRASVFRAREVGVGEIDELTPTPRAL